MLAIQSEGSLNKKVRVYKKDHSNTNESRQGKTIQDLFFREGRGKEISKSTLKSAVFQLNFNFRVITLYFYQEPEYRWIYIINEKNNYLEVRYFSSTEDLNIPFTKAAEHYILCEML